MIVNRKKKFLRVASICIMIILLAGSASFAVTVPADVADSAHKDAIKALVEAGVITGSPDGLFYPFDNLTRAQACVMIVKALDPPDSDISAAASTGVFSDMRGYGWAEGYVGYAAKQGIINGYPGGTFKPGNNVTCNEMLTMLLRAAGFKDETIGASWPQDFIKKAKEEEITGGLPEELPALATKEIAARMTHNIFNKLKAEENPEKEKENAGSGSWNIENMTFATGIFNEDLTAFAGIPISRDAAVYTYGIKANFKKDLALPAEENDYRKDTVHKYKLASTPCFYKKNGNEITMMILPMDAGFSGRIYGVINSVSNTINGKGERVYSVHTIAATSQVAWLTRDSSLTVPPSGYLDGEVYEMTSVNGMIRGIETAKNKGGNSHKDFLEITSGSWDIVKDFSVGMITLVDNYKFMTKNDTIVYVLNTDGESYRTGSADEIAGGCEIRAFSLGEDGEVAAYITVRKK
jgi:hypothetical protein